MFKHRVTRLINKERRDHSLPSLHRKTRKENKEKRCQNKGMWKLILEEETLDSVFHLVFTRLVKMFNVAPKRKVIATPMEMRREDLTKNRKK